MTGRPPKLSFALPVRNGENSIHRAIDSILGQSFGDFELVISDNASTDRTAAVCRAYAERDPRVRFSSNERDIGLLPNFNRAFTLARGEYFRWIGADDWLEPGYAEACVSTLDARPDAIAVTTDQDVYDGEGVRHFHPYHGPRVDSPLPHERFARMLWFLRSGVLILDPIYSMFRRSELEKTHLLRIVWNADRILAAELSLRGPFSHVPELLAHRKRPQPDARAKLAQLRPPGHPALNPSAAHRLIILLSIVRDANLGMDGRLRCFASCARYFAHHLYWTWRVAMQRAAGVGLQRMKISVDRFRSRPTTSSTKRGT